MVYVAVFKSVFKQKHLLILSVICHRKCHLFDSIIKNSSIIGILLVFFFQSLTDNQFNAVWRNY